MSSEEIAGKKKRKCRMKLTVVDYEKRGHIAYVTLNRPDKLNAMNAAMHAELGEIWQDFQGDPALRAAILSG